MKSKKIAVSSLFLIFLFFASCRQEADYVAPSGYPNTQEGNFEAFWNGIDQNYVFYEYTPADWDSLYNVYRPGINSNTTYPQLAHVFVNMMSQLIDGHKGLSTEFGDYGTLNNDYVKKYPEYFYFDTLLLSNYMERNSFLRIYGSYPDTTAKYVEIMSQNIKDHPIYYVRLNYFGDALQNSDEIKKLDSALNSNNNSNRDGLILDLRHNFGGDAGEFYKLVSKFINTNYNWGYSQTRLQRDRYTLSPMVPESVKPDGYGYYNGPIVILTNRYSFSASELSTMALKNLPNVVVIGDTTGGANGPISGQRDYTGDFTIPRGWKVQLAQKLTFDADKKIYEGQGVPPDLIVKQDKAAFEEGKDNVLEYAINYLSNK